MPADRSEAEAATEYTDQFNDDMEAYKSMSVGEFVSLPVEERLRYAQFLTDQIIERGIYDEFYQSRDTYVESVAANRDNTGSEIFSYFDKSLQIAFLQYVEGNNPKPLDAEDAQKLLSARFFDPTGETRRSGFTLITYQEYKNAAVSLAEPTAIVNNLSFGQDAGGLSTGLYGGLSTSPYNGREFSYRDILTKNNANGDAVYQRFVYCEFDSYDNTKQGAWLLESQELSIDGIQASSVLVGE